MHDSHHLTVSPPHCLTASLSHRLAVSPPHCHIKRFQLLRSPSSRFMTHCLTVLRSKFSLLCGSLPHIPSFDHTPCYTQNFDSFSPYVTQQPPRHHTALGSPTFSFPHLTVPPFLRSVRLLMRSGGEDDYAVF